MELIENLLQLLVTFVGAVLSGIAYRKSHRQAYFLLLCFYGCFALGALYWTLYLPPLRLMWARTLLFRFKQYIVMLPMGTAKK